jgi:hypothetical protein
VPAFGIGLFGDTARIDDDDIRSIINADARKTGFKQLFGQGG